MSTQHIKACELHAKDLMRVYAPHLLYVVAKPPAPKVVKPAPVAVPSVSRSTTLDGLTASPQVRSIVHDVCIAHHTTWLALIARTRAPAACDARADLYRRLLDFGWSFPRIGKLVGRDHTTIISAVGMRKRSA